MKLSQIILILVLISIPIVTCAALNLENKYDGLSVSDDATDLFVYFVKMAIVFGVIIAVLVIIFNGINMIMAQGEMAKIIIAKQRIFSVFIGLLILLGVYVIATTINPDLVIIKMDTLKKLGDSIFNGGGSGVNPDTIEFQEVPIGAIAESILAANSSKRIVGANDVTEELCYAYDKNGDTIDRNGDGQITPDGDTLRGVDMFYCIDELNQAIIKKIKALNADYLCQGKAPKGPMRTVLNEIKSKDKTTGEYNCNCTRCSNWSYLDLAVPYACGVIYPFCTSCDADGNCEEKQISACDSNCGCCGKSYYAPNFGCQTDPYTAVNDHDPCAQTTRDNIDCARNEIKLRIDGQGLNETPFPPGALAANGCAFTAFWEDPARDPEKFLTLNMAITRMESFENYYKNHLDDLNAAVVKMRDPYGERISMAEFQTLKARGDQKKEITSVPFTGGHGYNYDPIKYCREFNCTNKNADGTCISGVRDELTSSLYAKEQEFDQFYNVPDFKDRRICKVDDAENKEEYSYAGDGATFYYREKFKYEETYEKETLRMVTDEAEKGYMESLIPLGEIINDARKFTEKLLEFTGDIKAEIDNVKTKSMEFTELPKKCDCSINCNTHPELGGVASCNISPTAANPCPDNSCDSCSTCASNIKGQWNDSSTKGQCICCEDCEEVEIVDSAYYYCLRENKNLTIVGAPFATYCNDPFLSNTGCGVNYFWRNYVIPGASTGKMFGCYLYNSAKNYSTDYLIENPIAQIAGSCGCPGGADTIYDYNNVNCIHPGHIVPGWTAPPECYISAPTVTNLLPFWNIVSCSGKTVEIEPAITRKIYVCEGEEVGILTKADKKLIEDKNKDKTNIKWLEADVLTYSGLNCCDMYYEGNNYQEVIGESNVITMPLGFNASCAVEDGVHKIRVSKVGTTITNILSERGKPVDPSPAYYVCPVNELKDKQCRIFKYSDAFNSEPYAEDLIEKRVPSTGVDCASPTSSAVGHLQEIDLLAKRIENYGKGKNLKPGDPDRWTVLDILNLSRNKLDKCITGYSLPLKEGAKSYTLLSCEEGIDTLSSGSATIFPSFPYPSVPDMWNCQPYNSSYLTAAQKTACLNNKQHPDCTNAIVNLLDDYYCLQRAE